MGAGQRLSGWWWLGEGESPRGLRLYIIYAWKVTRQAQRREGMRATCELGRERKNYKERNMEINAYTKEDPSAW